ncbi:hypothetical protein U9M48_042335 [Paspalum notatum var. saurae]|uniref:Uncharacterized protein n=1 Tax=Paspalum notatum var. saurae TaxID=547442 RepID=A0AAQ3UQL7_PASNO
MIVRRAASQSRRRHLRSEAARGILAVEFLFMVADRPWCALDPGRAHGTPTRSAPSPCPSSFVGICCVVIFVSVSR